MKNPRKAGSGQQKSRTRRLIGGCMDYTDYLWIKFGVLVAIAFIWGFIRG